MRRDSHYLEDIRVAAELVAEFTAELTLAEFIVDVRTRSAVERQLIIAGEAAKQLSSDFKEAHPTVPWARLIQLRNFYVHGYDRLGPEEVWGTARRLMPRVARLIVPLQDQDSAEGE